jgi:hypothetical protein
MRRFSMPISGFIVLRSHEQGRTINKEAQRQKDTVCITAARQNQEAECAGNSALQAESVNSQTQRDDVRQTIALEDAAEGVGVDVLLRRQQQLHPLPLLRTRDTRKPNVVMSKPCESGPQTD